MHQEPREPFEQDQADRQGGMHQAMADRDRQRRLRLAALLAEEALQDADDSWRAHEIAEQGTPFGHSGCRWLAAAANDRWLVNQGRPQKYGTLSRTIDRRLEL
jgi:hypothetical protein